MKRLLIIITISAVTVACQESRAVKLKHLNEAVLDNLEEKERLSKQLTGDPTADKNLYEQKQQLDQAMDSLNAAIHKIEAEK